MKGNLNRKSTLTEAGNDQVQVFLMVSVDEHRMKVRAIAADGKVIDESTTDLKTGPAAQ